jgi:hypothetical protein
MPEARIAATIRKQHQETRLELPPIQRRHIPHPITRRTTSLPHLLSITQYRSLFPPLPSSSHTTPSLGCSLIRQTSTCSTLTAS